MLHSLHRPFHLTKVGDIRSRRLLDLSKANQIFGEIYHQTQGAFPGPRKHRLHFGLNRSVQDLYQGNVGMTRPRNRLTNLGPLTVLAFNIN